LAEERNINGVAVDTASLDWGGDLTFPAHLAILSRNIWAIENMANVDQLRPSGDLILALPHKIRDGSGAPIRAVALRQRKANGVSKINSSLALVFAFVLAKLL